MNVYKNMLGPDVIPNPVAWELDSSLIFVWEPDLATSVLATLHARLPFQFTCPKYAY